MTHKASLDTTATVVTVAVTVLFAGVVYGQLAIIKDTAGKAMPVFTTVACLLVYFIAFAFRPVKYTVTDNELIIHRPVLNVRVRRADIVSVETVGRGTLSGAIRTFGVGGLFGYYGAFVNSSIGRMVWYATRLDNAVLVKTVRNKKIVLSPNNTEDFVAEFHR